MNNKKKYYVYEYVDPLTNIPFYVGKGQGNRYLYHLKNLNDKSNPYKTNKIKKILKEGLMPLINLVKTGLTETQSFNIEKKIIRKYGRIDLSSGCLMNLSDGGEGQSGWIPNDEYKLNMSYYTSGNKNGMFGKNHSDETKNKIREKAVGRKLDDIFKVKMSENRQGEKNGSPALGQILRSTRLWRTCPAQWGSCGERAGHIHAKRVNPDRPRTVLGPSSERFFPLSGLTKSSPARRLLVQIIKDDMLRFHVAALDSSRKPRNSIVSRPRRAQKRTAPTGWQREISTELRAL
jgi:hypothetical protein